MRLAGSYHPLAYLVERVWELIPGVVNVAGYWRGFDQALNCVISSETYTLNSDEEMLLQKWRSKNITHNWLEDVNLFTHSPTTTLTIDNEQNLRSFTLFITSPVDGMKDILIIDFSPQIGLKSLAVDFDALSTNEKHLMSTLLSKQLTAEYERVKHERKILHHFSKTTNSQLEKVNLLETKLLETESKYKNALESLLQGLQEEWVNTYQKPVVLKPGLIERIASEQLSFFNIKEVLSEAVATAYYLNISSPVIEVSPEYIHLLEKEKSTESSISSKRRDKVFLLLDRYEDGAVHAKQKGLPVNGKNVAANLDEPVSPPAITDALKKNLKRIRFLLQEYPHHWPNIRKGLRPLSLLDEENKSKTSFVGRM